MPVKHVPASGRPSLEGLADVMTVDQAALGAGVSSFVIRQAIKRGELRWFTPGGGDPTKNGRGGGYRIRKAELQRWFLGEPIEEAGDAT